MAGDTRSTSADLRLAAQLREQPWAYEFFAALRRWECAQPERPRLGESTRVQDDGLRLGQEPSLGFAPAMLSAFEPASEFHPPRLLSLFFGLFGPNGPLPRHLTEYARIRQRSERDPGFARFADVFHHRMLSLLYRAWANAQPTVHHDRPQQDRFALYLGALCGIGLDAQREADAWPHAAKLHFCGHLAPSAKNAEGLRAMIEGYFGTEVQVQTFAGGWMRLPRADTCGLGVRSASLGRDLIIGGRVWGCQHNFRLRLGPMGLSRFVEFLPGRPQFQRLVALVRNYVNDELRWSLQPVLARHEVPRSVLGRAGALGWTSWLGTRAPDTDAADVCLTPPLGWDVDEAAAA